MVAFLYLSLVTCSVEYPMPYASCLVSCSVVWRWSSACPVLLCLMQLSLSLGPLLNGALLVRGFGLLQSLLSGIVHIALWDSLYGLCALWDSSSSFLSLLIGQVHSGMACLACGWLPFVRCPSKHIYCKTDHDWLLL